MSHKMSENMGFGQNSTQNNKVSCLFKNSIKFTVYFMSSNNYEVLRYFKSMVGLAGVSDHTGKYGCYHKD